MSRNNESFAYAVSRFFKFYLPGERGFSINTIASYRDTFKQFLLYAKKVTGTDPDKLELSDFSRDLVKGFLEHLEKEGKSVSTRNQRLAAIKSFFSYVRFTYPDFLDVAQAILGIRLKKHPEPVVSYLSVEGIALLLRQPNTSLKAGYRNMLMLTLLYDSGARVSELTNVCIGDMRLQPPATIILHGKGNKDRIVPLSHKTAALIQNYLTLEQLDRPETKDKLLFTNVRGTRLTRTGVTYILKKYVGKAREEAPDLFPKNITPHCIRHSKAMHLLQAGVGLIYIRDFLGHSQMSTTETYARADSESKRKALEAAYTPDNNAQATSHWNDDPSLMRFLETLCKQ